MFPIPPKIALESLLWRLKGSVQDRGLVSHALSLTSLPTWLAAEVPISEPSQEERREEAPSVCVPGGGGMVITQSQPGMVEPSMYFIFPILLPASCRVCRKVHSAREGIKPGSVRGPLSPNIHQQK